MFIDFRERGRGREREGGGGEKEKGREEGRGGEGKETLMCERYIAYTCPDWESNPPTFLVYGMMLQAIEPHWQEQNLSFII